MHTCTQTHLQSASSAMTLKWRSEVQVHENRVVKNEQAGVAEKGQMGARVAGTKGWK